MSNLFLFCFSDKVDTYVNILSLAASQKKFNKLFFLYIGFSDEKQIGFEKELGDKISNLSTSDNRYDAAKILFLNKSSINTDIIKSKRQIKLNAIRSDYFEISSLSKEDAIQIVTYLLSTKTYNIRSIKLLMDRIPRYYYEYNNPNDQFEWTNIKDIADHYADFIENREGSNYVYIFMSTIIIMFFTYYFESKFPALSNFIKQSNNYGGIFAFLFALFYFFMIIIKKIQRNYYRIE